MGVNEYIKSAIVSLELDKASFICNIEIDYADLKEVFPDNDKSFLRGGDLCRLEKMIKIYPLFGGNLDGNGRINLIIALKSDDLKLERVREEFKEKLKLKKRSD